MKNITLDNIPGFLVTMDNFHISIATIDHREEIREFLMKHFLVEETMNVHQRRGIAGKMLEKRKSLELLKEFKIQGFVCQASSYANQMLLRKRGYQELKDIPFARFADQNGTQLIKPHDQTRSVKLFWKPYNP
ncbi:hypothetical protein NECAME_07859 [Necator americanus]|uniref:N-acetyltransferase domain-containing protein n=1 Tax=Necator americanus TaxID=51031 RepID=W2TKI3_NECAM|nr:hypothetical protein NECAME_07859 [Necator americanus]ETN82605.1 hypothetical protein NECAME_07859 [Necator americanus]